MQHRSVAAFLGLALTTALPLINDSPPSPCTGGAYPNKTAPFCYTGNASVLGGAFHESVEITVKSLSFNHNMSVGTMDIVMAGAVKKACKSIHFKKHGQALVLPANLTKCLQADVTATYCSDQDTVALDVNVVGLAKVHATLSSHTCS